MKNDLRLFINDQEIEFSADPKILLNYRETELHNPTIVRNSYSKQITVEGTPRNNDIFGHIWDLTRIQEGMLFNPIKKTDFQLFLNDELFQKGYCKLDKVTRTNNTIQYAITLYGGLGSFFYNLSFEEGSGNNKKTLASLQYALEDSDEPDLDFVIDKDAVYEAWAQVNRDIDDRDKWDVINFIPCLNGIPNDFDAAKVLINNKDLNTGGYSGFANGKTEDGVTYRPVINGALNSNGYSLGETNEDLQEWQTRDLRSYNQRPGISFYRVIQACCNPQNNGGYQVKLDDHFFNYQNPYYRDAWMTLPMLKDLDGVGGGNTFNITGASIGSSSSQYGARMFAINYNTPAASMNNVSLSLSVRYNPSSSISAGRLYTHHFYKTTGGHTNTSYQYIDTYEYNSGVIVQLFALGQNGSVVAQSKAYLLAGSKTFFQGGSEMWGGFWDPDQNGGDIGAQPDYEYIEGYFRKINGNYVFCNKQGQKTNINFTFTAPSNFASIVMKVKTPYGTYERYLKGFWDLKMPVQTHSSPNSTVRNAYSAQTINATGNHTVTEAYSAARVDGDYGFVIESFNGIATDYEGLFSGTKITKDRLLTTEYTPAEYLLSYCKLFGLYFYYDSTEESDDEELYPAGVVHIMDRDTFYTDEVVDLSKMIDWEKKVEITPAMAASKWYRFDVEHTETELETGYEEQFGQKYGSQIVNTNYNFDSNTTDLYDGNVFKAGIMALEKDKYYKKSPAGLPVYQYNGMTYNLFYRATGDSEFNTLDMEFPVTTTMNMYPINTDYEFYDGFPKLQLHGEENAPVDGSNILVFYKGKVNASANYWLTDDVNEMVTLNDASPCWILTNSPYDAAGTQIATKVEHFPFFTRDLVVYGTYGNISHSWNFGHPQVIYSPDTYTTEGDSIYDVAWKNYIRDLYSVDTRKLTCYVIAQMDERPWPYWLRRFYWFENSIWALNEIKDLNPASFDTTKMEFIKVQDMDNYKLNRIIYNGSNSIEMTDASIGCAGGTVHGIVRMQSAGAWAATDYIKGVDGNGVQTLLETSQVMSPTTGNGATATTFTITVPANTGETPITWEVKIQDSEDNFYSATFVEETCNTGSTLEILPETITVYSPASSTTFAVYSNRVTNITYSTTADWVTLQSGFQSLTATYTQNSTNSQRQATITATGQGTEGTITATAVLKQDPPGSIGTSTNDLVWEWNEYGTKTFNIATHDDWTTTINDNS